MSVAATKIVIIGGKGTAVVIADQISDACKNYGKSIEVLGFAFDDESFGDEISGYPVIAKTYSCYEQFKKLTDVLFVYSLYRTDKMRERIMLRDSYKIPNDRYFTFVHPSAYVARSAKLSSGVIVCANTVVNSNAVIGAYTIINSSCLIGHDVTLAESCFLGGHTVLGSNITVGEGSVFGLNCTVRNFLTIGKHAIVGMASNVLKNVSENAVVVGNPAQERSGLNNPY